MRVFFLRMARNLGELQPVAPKKGGQVRPTLVVKALDTDCRIMYAFEVLLASGYTESMQGGRLSVGM